MSLLARLTARVFALRKAISEFSIEEEGATWDDLDYLYNQLDDAEDAVRDEAWELVTS